MKIIENKYGRFGIESKMKETRKELIASYLTFEIGKNENIETFKPFIKPECFDKFKDKMTRHNFGGHYASILNDDLLAKIKEEIYNNDWNNSGANKNALIVRLEVDSLNIKFSLYFLRKLSGHREGIEILNLLRNNLTERKEVLNRTSIFNPKTKMDQYGFESILIPDIEVKYFALDKEDSIVIMGPTDAFLNVFFSSSLPFINSIKAIKHDIDNVVSLVNEMQYEEEDDKFTTWDFIYPDTDIGEPHPEWIGQFIR